MLQAPPPLLDCPAMDPWPAADATHKACWQDDGGVGNGRRSEDIAEPQSLLGAGRAARATVREHSLPLPAK